MEGNNLIGQDNPTNKDEIIQKQAKIITELKKENEDLKKQINQLRLALSSKNTNLALHQEPKLDKKSPTATVATSPFLSKQQQDDTKAPKLSVKLPTGSKPNLNVRATTNKQVQNLSISSSASADVPSISQKFSVVSKQPSKPLSPSKIPAKSREKKVISKHSSSSDISGFDSDFDSEEIISKKSSLTPSAPATASQKKDLKKHSSLSDDFFDSDHKYSSNDGSKKKKTFTRTQTFTYSKQANISASKHSSTQIVNASIQMISSSSSDVAVYSSDSEKSLPKNDFNDKKDTDSDDKKDYDDFDDEKDTDSDDKKDYDFDDEKDTDSDDKKDYDFDDEKDTDSDDKKDYDFDDEKNTDSDGFY